MDITAWTVSMIMRNEDAKSNIGNVISRRALTVNWYLSFLASTEKKAFFGREEHELLMYTK